MWSDEPKLSRATVRTDSPGKSRIDGFFAVDKSDSFGFLDTQRVLSDLVRMLHDVFFTPRLLAIPVGVFIRIGLKTSPAADTSPSVLGSSVVSVVGILW